MTLHSCPKERPSYFPSFVSDLFCRDPDGRRTSWLLPTITRPKRTSKSWTSSANPSSGDRVTYSCHVLNLGFACINLTAGFTLTTYSADRVLYCWPQIIVWPRKYSTVSQPEHRRNFDRITAVLWYHLRRRINFSIESIRHDSSACVIQEMFRPRLVVHVSCKSRHLINPENDDVIPYVVARLAHRCH